MLLIHSNDAEVKLGNKPKTIVDNTKNIYSCVYGTGQIVNNRLFTGSLILGKMELYVYADGFVATYDYNNPERCRAMRLGAKSNTHFYKSESKPMSVNHILATLMRKDFDYNSYYVKKFKSAVCDILVKKFDHLSRSQQALITQIKIKNLV